MMRNAIFAAVALCPMLIHAQAASPAQTGSSAQGTTLQSALRQPAMLAASSSAAAATPSPRVSTGVTAPKLLQKVEIAESKDWGWAASEEQKTAVVSLVVDATGKPSDVHVVQSLGAERDRDLMASVSQYRFQPGTLDRVPTPIEVTLTIRIVNGRK